MNSEMIGTPDYETVINEVCMVGLVKLVVCVLSHDQQFVFLMHAGKTGPLCQ